MGGIGVPLATLGTGSSTWFFLASEEEQALRMTILEFVRRIKM